MNLKPRRSLSAALLLGCLLVATEDDSVMVADAIQVRRTKEIPLPGVWRPVWDSASNRVYVACGLDSDVAVIDCRTDSVIDRIRVGETPSALDLNTRPIRAASYQQEVAL